MADATEDYGVNYHWLRKFIASEKPNPQLDTAEALHDYLCARHGMPALFSYCDALSVCSTESGVLEMKRFDSSNQPAESGGAV